MVKKLGELGLHVIFEDFSVDYCRDEYPGEDYLPDAVVEAKTTEDVAAVMKFCHEEGIPVTVRGAGTGQVGGSVPVKGGVVLSVKNMNQILGYENGILRVQAGVLLQDVKAEAEKHGMYYPPDPGNLTATIGGNASTNARGPAAVKYGKTKDYVMDAVVVLPDGTVTTLSSKKDNFSIIGSEGTLGVICELSLKVIEKPAEDAILLFPFQETHLAIKAAKAIMDGGYDPAVVEYMDTDIIEFSGKITEKNVFPVEMDGERVAATLMVTIEGEDDDAVMEKMESLAGMTEDGDIECLDILVGDSISMKREFWTAHGAFHTSMESGPVSAYEVNIDVPFDAAEEMITFAKKTASAHDLKALIHSHLGSGGMHIHLASEKKREESSADAKAFCDAVYTKCTEMGGNIVGEYGVGYVKTEYLTEDARKAFAEKKAIFDPKGILNPGKIVV